jgi:hypothetical protein
MASWGFRASRDRLVGIWSADPSEKENPVLKEAGNGCKEDSRDTYTLWYT